MTAITNVDSNRPARVLYLAFELGWTKWNLAMTTGLGTAPRLRTIAARDVAALANELVLAKRRFGLPPDARVESCYEAGRDGFWLHRYLAAQGVVNFVVDSASIEVNRRARRAKSDALDVGKLLSMLLRDRSGESNVWHVVRVPSVADEDARQLHRELGALQTESTRHVNRIKGLLASCGLQAEVDEDLPTTLSELRQWDGTPLPPDLLARLLREHARWTLAVRHAKDLSNLRIRLIRRDETPQVDLVRRLLELRAIGLSSAWLFVREFFGWRSIDNRRQLAALAGLCPTPYHSGASEREQGISKAGNRRLRRMLVEIAWCWVRLQPASDLSRWYTARFAQGNARARKIGIVALARKLLTALWKYLKDGELPGGALVTTWEPKVNGKLRAATSSPLAIA
jgi:transposase